VVVEVDVVVEVEVEAELDIRVEAVKVQVWRKELVLCLEESVTEFCHEQFTPSNMFVVMPS
jgi:hypothetical protein